MRNLLLMTVLALAGDVAYAGNGLVYFGAGISRSELSDITPSGGLGIDNTSWKILGGFRPISPFAVELDYLDLGSASGSFVSVSAHSDAKAFAGYAVGFLPIPVPWLDVFGKAGLARWSLSGSTSVPSSSLFNFSNQGTQFAWGLGAQAHAGNIGGRLEYERFDVPNTNGARVFSLSVILSLP
jgi:hypothetical protein